MNLRVGVNRKLKCFVFLHSPQKHPEKPQSHLIMVFGKVHCHHFPRKAHHYPNHPTRSPHQPQPPNPRPTHPQQPPNQPTTHQSGQVDLMVGVFSVGGWGKTLEKIRFWLS